MHEYNAHNWLFFVSPNLIDCNTERVDRKSIVHVDIHYSFQFDEQEIDATDDCKIVIDDNILIEAENRSFSVRMYELNII